MSLSKFETDVAAALQRAYPNTAPGTALRTAIELVGSGAVYRDLDGNVRHTTEATRRAPGAFPASAHADTSDEARCARALAAEARVAGDLAAVRVIPARPADPRIDRAMAQEESLRAQFGDDAEES
jgi:hypothetical protein